MANENVLNEMKNENQNNKLVKHPVDSTNLEWVAYDEDKKELYIQFRSSGLYVYYNVPKNIFVDLLKAGSKGRYHNLKIKWKYDYKRIG